MFALMAFSTLVSALVAAGMFLIEGSTRERGYAARWLWIVALMAGVVSTVSPFLMRRATQETSTATLTSDGQSALQVLPAIDANHGSPIERRVPATPRAEAPAASGLQSERVSTDVVLAGAWLVVSAISALVLVMSAWRIARMRRAWRQAVIAGVPVLVSHDVGPAIVGLVHHGVVLPAWVESLTAEEQRLVLTHEREHVRAGDPLLLRGATLLSVLVPWNIAMWFSLRRLRHAIEMDCDARVLRVHSDARAYCALLLDVGERTLSGVAPMAALAEPSTLLERRVDAMTARRRGRWRPAVSAAVGVGLVIVACVAPGTKLSPNDRAVALVEELTTLLRSDSVVAAVPLSDRSALASRLAMERELPITVVPEVDSPKDWAKRLEPRMDAALASRYPNLRSRADTAKQLVVLTFSHGEGRLTEASLGSMPDLNNLNYAELMGGYEILGDTVAYLRPTEGRFVWIGRYERPALNVAVIVRVERATPSRRGQIAFILGNGADDLAEWSRRLAAMSTINSRGATIDKLLDATADSLYPGILTRPNTIERVLAIVYDSDGRVKSYSLRLASMKRVFTASDFTDKPILLYAARLRPSIHMQFAIVVENDDASIPRARAPDTVQTRRQTVVDSVARANYPDAFRQNTDAFVVAVLFDKAGSVIGTKGMHMPLDAAFDVVPGDSSSRPANTRSLDYLLRRAGFTDVPPLRTGSSKWLVETPHTVYVWGQAVR